MPSSTSSLTASFSSSSAILFLFFIISCIISFSRATKCPSLLDGQMLDFANPGGIRLHKTGNSACKQMFSCDVVSAPAETIIEWVYNGKVIRTTSAGKLAYMLGTNESGYGKNRQLGLSETSHRFCSSELLYQTRFGEKKRSASALFGLEKAEIRCRVRLACDASTVIESEPINIAKLASYIALQRRGQREIAEPTRRLVQQKQQQRKQQPPSIYMVTSSRMELAGNAIQLVCRSKGQPKPRVQWTVFGVDGAELEQEKPTSDFPFIMELNNGDLIVDTAMTDKASLTLRCEAKNGIGEGDSATSTIILLKE